MSKEFRLVIELENAAFEDEAGSNFELARILRKYADRIENGAVGFATENVRDVNGNTVGSYAIKTREQWVDGFASMVRASKKRR